MGVTITAPGGVTAPLLALSLSLSSSTSNVIHDIPGLSQPYVSVGPEGSASGEISLFYLTRAAAFAAKTLHTTQGPFSYVDTDNPELAMTYVRAGQMSVELDPQTSRRWVLRVGYRQVA